jgi:hypothetical protein
MAIKPLLLSKLMITGIVLPLTLFTSWCLIPTWSRPRSRDWRGRYCWRPRTGYSLYSTLVIRHWAQPLNYIPNAGHSLLTSYHYRTQNTTSTTILDTGHSLYTVGKARVSLLLPRIFPSYFMNML